MIRSIFISLLRSYQILISPWLGNRCRFYPSCSEYMIESVRRFGVFKGIHLGIKRLARCQPLCEGGIDPVPDLDPLTNKPVVKPDKCSPKENTSEHTNPD